MPAAFIGHGDPRNALSDNAYTRAWRALGESLPEPRAVVVISAHWYVGSTLVTAMERPHTIHDFYGFPQELYDVEYPAPGSPEIAAEVVGAIAPRWSGLDHDGWGLDHGTWSVMVHLLPAARVPVLQLSVNATEGWDEHFDLGVRLAPLRSRGVLVLGSGNVVHNLAQINWDRSAPPYGWAVEFEAAVKSRVLERDHQALIHYDDGGGAASWSIPTPDHYLPLLYVLGAQRPDEAAAVPLTGIDHGSISMLAVAVG